MTLDIVTVAVLVILVVVAAKILNGFRGIDMDCSSQENTYAQHTIVNGSESDASPAQDLAVVHAST